MHCAVLQDRLVGYDRDAAKRTAVIDDQSDFFEIDSNAWLTPEVRITLATRPCFLYPANVFSLNCLHHRNWRNNGLGNIISAW